MAIIINNQWRRRRKWRKYRRHAARRVNGEISSVIINDNGEKAAVSQQYQWRRRVSAMAA